MNPPAGDESRRGVLPPAAADIFRFQIGNAFSWSLILGFPMILYFSDRGASALVLGIVMGVVPLMTLLQVPAAGFVEKVGYRRMVFSGWSSRTILTGAMALVAVFTDFLSAALAMGLMLAGLTIFSALRGISSSALLPWFTLLIPEEVRGRYLSVEQICILGAALVTALLSALVFELFKGPTGFAVIFGIAFVAGLVSLLYLRRIPDVEVPVEKRVRQRTPWRAVLAHRLFLRLVLFDVICILAWTGSGVSVVPMLRDQFGIGDGEFMLVHAGFTVVSILALVFIRGVLDRAGSKPLLQAAVVVQVLHFAGWWLIAAGIVPVTLLSLAFTQGSWGIVHALFHTANSRLLMQIVPPEGRSHFFAIHTVAISAALGLFPVGWGFIIDRLSWADGTFGPIHLTPYSLVYTVVVFVPLVAGLLLRGIREDRTMSFHDFVNEFLVKTPASALSRLAVRRPRLR